MLQNRKETNKTKLLLWKIKTVNSIARMMKKAQITQEIKNESKSKIQDENTTNNFIPTDLSS